MPRARYKSLVDTFAENIRSGTLAPGTRRPTHRQLAADHGLALVTASRVYTELEAMGLVSGETGRGTTSQALKRSLSSTSKRSAVFLPTPGSRSTPWFPAPRPRIPRP